MKREKLDLLEYVEFKPNRYGKERYYFRHKGERTRLPDDYGSPEFMQMYWNIRNGIAVVAAPEVEEAPTYVLPDKPTPHTVQHLFHSYQQHAVFLDLDPETQSKRRSIMHKMMLEPMSPTNGRLYGCMPLAEFNEARIEVLRNRKKATPFAADERLKVLRQAMEVGIKLSLVKTNYAVLVKPYRKRTNGHETMLDEETKQYIEHHGTESKAVLALTIMMYTGVRVSDLRHLGPQYRRGDILQFPVFKGRNKNPQTLTIAIHPILSKVLDMHPPKGLTYMVTDFGNPFKSAKSLGNRVSDWMRQAGMPHLSAHSVRKGLATSLAENEATDSMLDGLFGWTDGKTSKIYTKKAQRSKLAKQAVGKINWGQTENDLPPPENKVVAFIAPPKKKVG